MPRKEHRVPIERLRVNCDPSLIEASRNNSGIIGQEEALESVKLGLEMADSEYEKCHYNIAVVGTANTGRTAKTVQYVKEFAEKTIAPPPDLVCVHNFEDPYSPILILLPAGRGIKLEKGLTKLVNKESLPKIYVLLSKLRGANQENLSLMAEKHWKEMSEKIAAYGCTIQIRDGKPTLFNLSLKNPGEIMEKPERKSLPEDTLKKMDEMADEAMKMAQKEAEILDGLEKEEKAIQKIQEIRLVKTFVKSLINPLRLLGSDTLIIPERTGKLPPAKSIIDGKIEKIEEPNSKLKHYLDNLEKKMVEMACFEPTDQDNDQMSMILSMGGALPDPKEQAMKALSQFTKVNLMVNNDGQDNPPVIQAKTRFPKLFGRYYGKPNREGILTFDHTMIEPGDLLRANGGYLIVDLKDLLRWSNIVGLFKLLKIIRDRKMAIETVGDFVGVNHMIKFSPSEIEVDVKVILICDRGLVHILRHYEPEFDNLFRIQAEFDTEMDVSEAPAAYATFAQMCQDSDGLLPFSQEAIAKLVEYGIRLTGDQEKASLELGIIKNIMTEAAHLAKTDVQNTVEAKHVIKAIKDRYHRRSLGIRKYLKMFEKNRILIDLEGMKVGQINGLAVIGLSKEVTFGILTRVTAQAFAGKGNLTLVQNTNKTSGPSTISAVEAIHGWILGTYGKGENLSLSVQINFEQSYSGIDGDSASLAKTIVVLSAISGLPIDQSLAITGSMNQLGNVQPIGGANHKIEGMASLVKARGLMKPGGGHGVVLPIQNVDNLMLDEEVVEAVRQDKFQVLAVNHINEAIEIFFRMPAEDVHEAVRKALKSIGKKNSGKNRNGFLARIFSRKKGTDKDA